MSSSNNSNKFNQIYQNLEGYTAGIGYQPSPKDLLKLVCQYDFTLEDIKELQAYCVEKLCEQRDHNPSRVSPESCDCGLKYFEDHLSW